MERQADVITNPLQSAYNTPQSLLFEGQLTECPYSEAPPGWYVTLVLLKMY